VIELSKSSESVTLLTEFAFFRHFDRHPNKVNVFEQS